MKKIQWGVTAALVGGMFVSGCNAEQFNSMNATFKQVKTASKAVETTSTIAGAAIATNIAVVELMNAISGDAKGVIAAGGANVIAAGGANVIAAGGANYRLAQVETKLEGNKGRLVKKDASGKTVVDASFEFNRSSLANNGFHYEVTNFKGTTSGFTISCGGSFDFKPLAGGRYQVMQVKSIPASINCVVTGEISAGKARLVLEKLGFALDMPTGEMPDTVEKLGEFRMLEMADGKTKMSIDASVGIKNKQVTAKAEIKDADGKLVKSTTIDESGMHDSDGAK